MTSNTYWNPFLVREDNGKPLTGQIIYGVKIEHYVNGILHREDGPAVERNDELPNQWYYNGERFYVSSQEEFERMINLLAFK